MTTTFNTLGLDQLAFIYTALRQDEKVRSKKSFNTATKGRERVSAEAASIGVLESTLVKAAEAYAASGQPAVTDQNYVAQAAVMRTFIDEAQAATKVPPGGPKGGKSVSQSLGEALAKNTAERKATKAAAKAEAKPQPETSWEERKAEGDRREAEQRLTESLKSGDPEVVKAAKQAAKKVGIDPYAHEAVRKALADGKMPRTASERKSLPPAERRKLVGGAVEPKGGSKEAAWLNLMARHDGATMEELNTVGPLQVGKLRQKYNLEAMGFERFKRGDVTAYRFKMAYMDEVQAKKAA